jgi:IS4 transposase
MNYLSKLVSAVQSLFGKLADEAAQTTNVILRKRKLTPQGLAATFVLGFLRDPNASDEQLAQMATTVGEPVSPQAIAQRYHTRMVEFLRTLFGEAVKLQVHADRVFAPILERFTDVQLLDSTTISLPAEMASEFPGCGGSHGGKAAMKLQVRMSLKTGCCDTIRIEAGRDCDGKTPLQKDTPIAGSLRIADLGYFDTKTFEIIDKAGAYWLSPFMTGTSIYDADGQPQELMEWLEKTGPVVDCNLGLTARQIRCRMIAWRLPPPVAKRRRDRLLAHAQRKGNKVSKQRLDRCPWAILITNLSAAKLSIDEARVLYRSRWQIELLFKRWKSQGRVADMTGSSWIRCMVKLWSRLLAAVLQQWLQCGVWGRPEMSLKKVWDMIRSWSNTLAVTWRNPPLLRESVERILATAHSAARQNKRKSRSTFEMLKDPSKLTYPIEGRAVLT